MNKIIIVDDHSLFREGIKLLIENEQLGCVVAEAENGKAFLDLLDQHQPDLVIMDIEMPVMNGIEATKRANEIAPGIKTLVLSMYGDEGHYHKMIEAGANGFLLKNSDMKEFETAIKVISTGESFFSNALLRNIIATYNKRQPEKNALVEKLTQREIDILKYICSGLTNEEIADSIHLSVKTVKTHRANIFEKTGCKNAPNLVLFAIKNV
jgi:DNA-binding NarL/FixJ family response regulator